MYIVTFYTMVSKLYPAKEFYELQEKGKIAKYLGKQKRLHKSKKGDFYVFKKNNKGELYPEKIKPNDLVYSRSEGVTKYSKELDRKRKSRYWVETAKQHKPYAHEYDREANTGKKYKI